LVCLGGGVVLHSAKNRNLPDKPSVSQTSNKDETLEEKEHL